MPQPGEEQEQAPRKRTTTSLFINDSQRHDLLIKAQHTHTLRLVRARPVVIGSLPLASAFRGGGRVFAPDAGGAAANGVGHGGQSMGLLAGALAHLERAPDARLVVAGHATDEPTGVARASSLRAVLAGDREVWAALGLEHARTDEWQALLAWANTQRGWGCDPGGADGKVGPRTRKALRRFRDGAGVAGGDPDGPGAADWAAWLDLVDDLLALHLGVERAALAARRGPALAGRAVGCGDAWPLERVRIADYPGLDGERVDLLLFAPGDAPTLRCHAAPACEAKTCDVFRKGKYAATTLQPAFPPRPRVQILDLEDVGMHHDSAVLLPAGRANDEGAPPAPEPDKLTGVAVIAAALRFARRNPDKRLLVAGHTDTSGAAAYNLDLSSRRARDVLAYLRGDREAWAKESQAHHVTRDWQQVLAWVATAQGLDTDPGPVDGKAGPTSNGALRRFREHVAAEGGPPAHGGPVGLDDWRAFYDRYEFELARRLATDAAGLAAARATVQFVAPAFVGCGESWPIEAAGVDGFRSATNRRVELQFFDPDEVPALACHAGPSCQPALCDLFTPGRYEVEYLPPSLADPPPPVAGWDVPDAGLDPTHVDVPEGPTAGWSVEPTATIDPTHEDRPAQRAGWSVEPVLAVDPTHDDRPASRAGWSVLPLPLVEPAFADEPS